MHLVRRLALLPLVAAALSACGSSSGTAAIVDGTRISHRDVVDELEAIRANEPYVDAIQEGGEAVLGESEDAFDAAFVATQLGVRINYALIANEVDRRGIDVDDECVEQARVLIVERFGRAVGDGEALLDGFPEDYRDYLVRRDANLLALQGDLIGQPCVVDDALEAYFAEHAADFEVACAAVSVVADEAAAQRARTELAGGGGEQECFTRGEAPAIEDVLFGSPLGQPSEPVPLANGLAVVRVDERRPAASLDEARDAVRAAYAEEADAAFREWYLAALESAEVDIDDRYGEWDAQAATVRRPGGASDDTGG